MGDQAELREHGTHLAIACNHLKVSAPGSDAIALPFPSPPPSPPPHTAPYRYTLQVLLAMLLAVSTPPSTVCVHYAVADASSASRHGTDTALKLSGVRECMCEAPASGLRLACGIRPTTSSQMALWYAQSQDCSICVFCVTQTTVTTDSHSGNKFCSKWPSGSSCIRFNTARHCGKHTTVVPAAVVP